jgi:tRNA 2-selenouridine synthase
MAVEKKDIEAFLQLAAQHPVLDVRSPGEYNHAHIPGAYNLPLFSDDERKEVGTAYKQQSRETAIKMGLDYFGPKMRALVEEVEAICGAYNGSRTILAHCWRGGMRSGAVAWLLDLYGFKVMTLAGGYKQYRRLVLQQFEKPYLFYVLGGYTGSGKTYVLQQLQQKAQSILDLESLAVHKGSAFGAIGLQEMFENLLAQQLMQLPASQPTWVEDESQRIGLVNVPITLWNHMRNCPVYFLDIAFEERLNFIVEEYGSLNREKLKDAVDRIQKRLGGLETKTALQFLEEGDMKECFRILLKYYDKWYLKGLNNREELNSLLQTIACTAVDAVKNAAAVLQKITVEHE